MLKDFKLFMINWWDDFKRISYVDTKWLAVWIFIYLAFLSLDVFFPEFWGFFARFTPTKSTIMTAC